MRFHIPIENIHLEGILSQNFDICLSFSFMKKNHEKIKIFSFFDIKIKLAPISTFLRHSSLQMNVSNMLVKFENDQLQIKRAILDKKIKVEK